MPTELDEYFATQIENAVSATGARLSGGTVIAPDAGRAGSGSATSYPTPSGTIVWCDAALIDTLGDVLGDVMDRAVGSEEFVDLATRHGATLSGFGNNRVLVGDVVRLHPDLDGIDVRVLNPESPGDLAALTQFVGAASEEDLDEADLSLDDLDPFIVGLFDGELMIAYGSGLPYDDVPAFDDIGVLTHPAHRCRGLGARVVEQFIDRRQAADPTRKMLYRCTTENAGSNAIAESLGFTLAHTIGAVRFST